MIQIRDLLIERNGLDALRIDWLEIQRGETLTIVGPNGAGKSTLLLALARLLKPSHGDILYEGKPLKQWNELEYRRRISIVFQSPLLMDMTVEQNVALGLKFRGMLKEEIRCARLEMDEAAGSGVARKTAGRSIIRRRGAEGFFSKSICPGTRTVIVG